VPRLCKLYRGIYLTTEEKARKNLSSLEKLGSSDINIKLDRGGPILFHGQIYSYLSVKDNNLDIERRNIFLYAIL
jgi:hypothetical protein